MLIQTTLILMIAACSGNEAEAIAEYVGQLKDAWFLKKALDAYPLHLLGQSQYATDYNLTENCFLSMATYQVGFAFLKEWALLMADSDGLPPSGMFYGNLQEVGFYEECHRAKATGEELLPGLLHNFDAKYCKAFVFIEGTSATSSVGVCAPATCTAVDIQHMLAVGNNSRLAFDIYCGEKKISYGDNVGAIVVTAIVSIFIAIIACATATDWYLEWRKTHVHDAQLSGHVNQAFEQTSLQINSTGPNGTITGTGPDGKPGNVTSPDGTDRTEAVIELQLKGDTEGAGIIGEANGTHSCEVSMTTPNANVPTKPQEGKALSALMTFSLIRNVPRVLCADTSPGSYTAFHGIRFLSMSWIVLGHTWVLGPALPQVTEPYYAVAYVVENQFSQDLLTSRWTHGAINNMSLAVDTFLLLSSSLVAISFMKQLDRNGGRPTIRQMVLYYFHRYWRLTPVYAAIMMISATTYYYWGNGPMYPLTAEYENCKDSWWTNLLYINNLVRTDKLCLGHTWYLAIDFQYYVIAPLFVFIIYKFTIPGSVLLFLGYCGTLAARSVLHNDDAALQNHFLNIYIAPWCRFGPYAIGIALGYLMFRTKCKVKLPIVVVVVGWLVAIALCLAAVYGAYNIDHCGECWTAYYITYRDAFSLGIAWLMFACCTGYGGLANRFLSWSAFVPLARLTYVGYLIHPMIMFATYYGLQRPVYVEDLLMSVFYCAFLLVTLVGAFAITLVFEVPMLELEKVFIPRRKK